MESLTRTDTGKPLGELATYSLRSTATPFDPSDSSGQIPTFNAVITDVVGDTKALVGSNVSLRDWTGFPASSPDERGNLTRGKVTAMQRNTASGAVALDNSTIFERLNTDQTTLPILQGDTLSNVTAEAIEHMCLMAGVPRYSIEGNVKTYISKYNQIGYLSDSIYKWRYFAPTTPYTVYVTSEGSLGGYAPQLEVNPAQGVTFGGNFEYSTQVSEFRVNAYLPNIQSNVIYTVRRNNTAWALTEKVGAAAATVLKTFTYTPTLNNPVYFFVQVNANAAADKVDVTFRLMEFNSTTKQTVYTDSTSTAIVSTLRNRPKPFQMELGWDSTLTSGKTFAAPEVSFIVEKAVLQENYPVTQVQVSPFIGSPTAAEIAKLPDFVPGFTGNVWTKMKEFCSILDLDIQFKNDTITVRPREALRKDISGDFIPAVVLAKSQLSEQVQDRNTAQSIEVNFYERVPGADNFDVMFKADSVYSLDKGETKVEVVKSENTFIFLNQPIPVAGVPVPYTSPFSSYVVTGNDGFIVDPQWWKANGGSIKVDSTGVSGEVKITMQAPTVDTVRAPYRISEGVADRPALYVVGYGLALKDPVAMKIYTGNPSASQEVGTTFDSTFMTKKIMGMNAGSRIASVYGTGEASINFRVNRGDYVPPVSSSDAPTPIGDSVYWQGSYYRITDQTVEPRGITFTDADTSNTIGVVNGEFSEAKTIADWNTLHDLQTISDVNMAPLPIYQS